MEIVKPPGPAGIELRDAVNVGQRHRQRPARIPDGRTRGHRAEGHDLRDPILAVLFGDVRDHFVASLDAKIGVDIGHRDTLGVEKALEEQIEAQRIEVGDLEAVRDERADRRAAPRAHRNPAVARVFDEVPYDQEIGRESHLRDHFELVVEAGAQARIVCDPVFVEPFAQPKLAELAQILGIASRGVVRFARHGVLRQMKDLFGNPDVDPIGDARRILTGLGIVAPQVVHLRRALEIELIGVEFHPVRIGNGLARADAEQHVVRRRVFLFEVV